MLRRAALKVVHWISQVPLLPPPPSSAMHPHQRAAISDECAKRLARAVAGRPASLRLLSQDPLVLVADDFLTPAECALVIDFARSEGGQMMAGEVDSRDMKFDLGMWPEVNYSDSALQLEAIYQRIDGLLGVPRQPTEVAPKVAYSAPRPGGGVQAAGRRMPIGLHVDTNAVFTYATAIVYLSSVPQPGGDGATVFPIATAVGAPPAAADQAAEDPAGTKRGAGQALLFEQVLHTTQAHATAEPHAAVLEAAADRGEGLSIFPEAGGWPNGQHTAEGQPRAVSGHLRRSLRSDRPGVCFLVSLSPLFAGKLLVFFSRRDDGHVDPSSFHGGAAVQSGAAAADGDDADTGGLDGKWVMQLCKEVPVGQRSEAARAEFVAARRRHVLDECVTVSTVA
eukprot:SAG22_NODE_2763_length_2230_cov_1.861098_2_plen_395_part_00